VEGKTASVILSTISAGPLFKTIWEDMATWSYITDSTKTELIDGVKSEMGKREMDELVRWRDDKLIKLLKVIYNE
jgi:hypothetical protein